MIDREKKWELWDALNGPKITEEPITVNDETTNDGGTQFEKRHWCEQIKTRNTPEGELWASCNPYEDNCNGGSNMARINNDEYLWTSTNDER